MAQVETPLSTLLSWHVFWYGPEGLRNYKSGTDVEAAVIVTHSDVALFLASVGLEIQLRRLPGGDLRGESINPLPRGTTNSAEVAEYLKLRASQQTDDRVSKDNRFAKMPSVPPSRYQEQSPFQYCETRLLLRLPPLKSPSYIMERLRPAELPSLVRVVQEDLESSVKACGGHASAVIPFSGPGDPRVFVSITREGGSCNVRGHATYTKGAAGNWLPSLKAEPTELDGGRMVRLIETYPAATLRVP